MQKSEIKVGRLYTARISGNVVVVRVDNIRVAAVSTRSKYSGATEYRDRVFYDITNLCTKRATTFKSAAKFRNDATDKPALLSAFGLK